MVTHVAVQDIAAVDDFYGDYLGLRREDMGLDWVVRYLAPSGANLQLLTRDASPAESPVVSIAVEDVDETYEEAVRRGYDITTSCSR